MASICLKASSSISTFFIILPTPGTIEAYIIIERECNNETDCSVAEIQADLKECKWYLGTDLVDGNGPLMFTENGVALNGNVIGGWSLSLVEGHIYLTLDLSGDYMNISKEWKLVECDDDRLQFISGDYTLVLEQECDNSNPFECYSSLEYGICDDGDVYDGITTFNLNEIYPNCNEDNVEVSFHATENEAHNNVNPLTTTYTNTNNQETIFVRVTLAGTNEYEIFVVLLYVEDCSTSACTEEVLDSYLMEFECYWVAVSVDGSNAFDDYAIQFNENQDLLIEGNGSNVFGTWSTAGNPTNGVFLTITQLENNFSVINGQWLVTECGPERIVLVDGDHEMIIERVCP
jgi:FlaG/FlaF family flagellin (archaellin)